MPREPSEPAPSNPFKVGVLATGEHFANREREVSRIARTFREAGSRLVVFGDRRLGKSSAVHRAAEVVRRESYTVAIASLATATNSAEAVQRILTSVRSEVGHSWRELLQSIASRLSVGLVFQPPAEPGRLPSVKLDVSLAEERAQTDLLPDALDAIDQEMSRRGEHLGLGLDEFQRLHAWGGEEAEWAFRESIQRHESMSYVLIGSERGLIRAMISDKGRALWKTADVLQFGPMAAEKLSTWIRDRAAESGVEIREPAADEIVRLAGPRTRDVVQLARAAWFVASPRGRVSPEDVRSSFDGTVDESFELYRTIWSGLNALDQDVLRALAAEEDLQPTSSEALRRYDLGPKSSVQSALNRLVESEHLERRSDGEYDFDDPYFRRWVQLHALPDIGVEPPQLRNR